MRISKEALFNVLNLQTFTPEGALMNMFTQKGDATYVIEVVGTLPKPPNPYTPLPSTPASPVPFVC